jgi:hypothetical protein
MFSLALSIRQNGRVMLASDEKLFLNTIRAQVDQKKTDGIVPDLIKFSAW